MQNAGPLLSDLACLTATEEVGSFLSLYQLWEADAAAAEGIYLCAVHSQNSSAWKRP